MLIQIKSRFNSSVLFDHTCENNTLKITLEAAVKIGARLVGANLDGAILDRARLVGANLDGASLVGANLVGASLDRASLVGANLDGASLDGVSLVGASLVGARLDRASLIGSRLDGSNLVGSSFDGSRLDGASLIGASLVGATYGIAKLTRGIIQLIGYYWTVFIFDAHIKIGCKLYSTEDWINFSDNEIAAMDSEAAEFWKANKDIIIAIAKHHQK